MLRNWKIKQHLPNSPQMDLWAAINDQKSIYNQGDCWEDAELEKINSNTSCSARRICGCGSSRKFFYIRGAVRSVAELE